MSNIYLELKQKHQKEVNEFPMAFAFSNKQFKEGMEKLGLTEHDTDKVYSFGSGGFYRKTDAEVLHEMLDRHDRERKENLTNEEYVYQMFRYELGNHEYCITYDLEDTLNACDITSEMIQENEMLANALERARKDYLSNCEY